MSKQFIDKIVTTLPPVESSTEPKDVWIRAYNASAEGHVHQAVLFLKPEVLDFSDGVNVEAILQIVFEALSRFHVEVGAIRILNAQYLGKFGLMDRHYGVINKISREGRSAISETAEGNLQKHFSKELAEGATVLGGHQFLERFPQVSPFALNLLSDNLGTTKLAGGTYCVKVSVLGSVFLILNPFHPFQLQHFTDPGRAIVVMEIRTNTPWRVLRESLTGATNPLKAAEGSIRRTFLERQNELHLREVSQGANGIHVSAGPLEGMVEIQRFFDDRSTAPMTLSATSFGQRLLKASLPESTLDTLATNPSFERDGKLISAFDATEECDAVPAAEKLMDFASAISPR